MNGETVLFSDLIYPFAFILWMRHGRGESVSSFIKEVAVILNAATTDHDHGIFPATNTDQNTLVLSNSIATITSHAYESRSRLLSDHESDTPTSLVRAPANPVKGMEWEEVEALRLTLREEILDCLK
jgi:hypothetical protein